MSETKLTPDLEHQCLNTDPFGDCFGSGEIVLSDKMVTAAKDHLGVCNICGGDVIKGSRSRVRVEREYGEIQTYRWCELCCCAMAVSNEDNGEAWESRVRLCFNKHQEGAGHE